jgi:predicted RNase H-like HicB family nuclease
MKYLVIYEQSATGWAAYSPDIPGLTAEGKTLGEVKERIRETMELHLKGAREDGASAPAPSEATEYIRIDSHA